MRNTNDTECTTQGDLMARTIAYLRVSTDEQAASGLGLEAQRAAIRKAVRETDAVITDDGYTGSNLRRPGIWEALKALGRGDKLVVARRDRLGRGMDVMLEIERELRKRGASVISVAGEGTGAETGDAIFQRRIHDAANEYELWRIKERTAAAMAAKRQRNEYCGGGLPFGFELASDGTHLVEQADEQKAIALVRELQGRGWTLRGIGAEMERRGIHTKTGRTAWNPKTVRSLLKRAA